ncbi:prepilin-type cleavage/methylation domain-containing protein [Alicyclobacillus suci]|uniref:prepilin-type cleavage/methylation domain-containing protein n=1 Tax=Alicyclobacillus suci TaxID=2816080 RepID=UPI001F335E2B|nr:prepilin-type cleavage/methylation domain-containing protein [Alicyclobacillus suci]
MQHKRAWQMQSCWGGASRPRERSGGFTLLETVVAVAVTVVAFSMVVPMTVVIKRAADLDSSALDLITNLRTAQSIGATSDQAGIIWLDPYDTNYHMTQGTVTTGTYSLATDVTYVDGYLQLPNRRISYDNLGDAQVAGKIRLTDGRFERDIDVYMGAGLQQAGWLSP